MSKFASAVLLAESSAQVGIIGFVLMNFLTLLLGGILSILSYRVYRRRKTRSFKVATIGFVTITVASIIEAVYEIGVRRSFELSGEELILLHTVESLLLAAGLGLLFYSIMNR